MGMSIRGLFIVHDFEELVSSGGKYSLPLECRWKYRSNRSATSVSMKRAGLTTRIHQAIRLSFPLQCARLAVARLVVVHLCLGFQPVLILQVLEKLRGRYSRVFAEDFSKPLFFALKRNIVEDLILLGREWCLKITEACCTHCCLV